MDSDNESAASWDSSVEEDARLEDYQLMTEENISGIKQNNPAVTKFNVDGGDNFLQDWTSDDWEQLGRSISNNNHLRIVELENGVLDDEKMSYLFGGLTKSGTIKHLYLSNNGLSVDGVKPMLKFLQNSNNLDSLTVQQNSNIKSEGFSLLWRA